MMSVDPVSGAGSSTGPGTLAGAGAAGQSPIPPAQMQQMAMQMGVVAPQMQMQLLQMLGGGPCNIPTSTQVSSPSYPFQLYLQNQVQGQVQPIPRQASLSSILSSPTAQCRDKSFLQCSHLRRPSFLSLRHKIKRSHRRKLLVRSSLLSTLKPRLKSHLQTQTMCILLLLALQTVHNLLCRYSNSKLNFRHSYKLKRWLLCRESPRLGSGP